MRLVLKPTKCPGFSGNLACRAALVAALMAAALSPLSAFATFSAGISPPRFELAITPGKKEQKVIALTNPSAVPAKFKVYTSDWSVDESGKLTIEDPQVLKTGSCRPWVSIEREQFTLPPGGTLRYRFDVQTPSGWTGEECRFMIFFEGDDPIDASGIISANGRLGVTVYVRPAGAVMSAEIMGAQRMDVQGKSRAALSIRNNGTATVRPSGNLEGVDGSGKRRFFSVSSAPVFPGRTKLVPLSAIDPLNPYVEIDQNWTVPFSIKGKLRLSEIDQSSIDVDMKLPP